MNLLKSEWREEKLLTWAFGGLWIFVTAFLWAPSRDGLEAVYALVFFIPAMLLLLWQKPKFYQYGGWFSVSALTYAGWSCVTSRWGSGTGFLILQWLILAVWLAGSTWVLHRKALDWDRFLRWFVVVGAITASINMIAFYWSHPFAMRMEGITITRASTLVGQIYGLVGLMSILLSWRTQCFKCAIGLSITCIPSLIALGLSQSRGPLLSLIIVSVIGLLWLRPGWKILLTQCSAALAVLAVLFLIVPLDQILLERGTSLRDEIWLDVIAQMRVQPGLFLWGVGMRESTEILMATGVYHHAHNAWLDILYRTGIIGLILAVMHLSLLLWSARHHRSLALLTLWLVYGCGCLLVDSRSLFWEIDTKWLLYWIPSALLAASLVRMNSVREKNPRVKY